MELIIRGYADLNKCDMNEYEYNLLSDRLAKLYGTYEENK